MTTPPEFSQSNIFKDWFNHLLPNLQAANLAIILLAGFGLIYFLAELLLPVFAAIVIAYLLEGVVSYAEKKELPRLPCVLVVFSAFIAFLGFVLFVLIPMLYKQTIDLIERIPSMISTMQMKVMELPEMYPNVVTEEQVMALMQSLQTEMLQYGQDVLSVSAASFVSVITAVIFLVLLPVVVFFLLKDKTTILVWFSRFLPEERLLSMRVWKEVDIQIGRYIRGKFFEVLLLWLASFITFSLIGLNYSMLLAVFMGLSVIIPYVGATLVTLPVLGVALFQWGLGSEFIYAATAYSIIQAIDGVVLVPLLFSEAVNIHPIAIIVAILFFGGIWGMWGVFFAIPLATVVQAVLTAWPKVKDQKVVL
jgi:putative permease